MLVQYDWNDRYRLAADSDTPREIIMDLLEEGDARIDEKIAMNSSITDEYVAIMVKRRRADGYILQLMARNPQLSKRAIFYLAKKNDALLRKNILKHPKCDEGLKKYIYYNTP